MLQSQILAVACTTGVCVATQIRTSGAWNFARSTAIGSSEDLQSQVGLLQSLGVLDNTHKFEIL